MTFAVVLRARFGPKSLIFIREKLSEAVVDADNTCWRDHRCTYILANEWIFQPHALSPFQSLKAVDNGQSSRGGLHFCETSFTLNSQWAPRWDSPPVSQ